MTEIYITSGEKGHKTAPLKHSFQWHHSWISNASSCDSHQLI